jgi:hypothetical protein
MLLFIIILQHVSAAYAGHHQVETPPQRMLLFYEFVSLYLMMAGVRGRNML